MSYSFVSHIVNLFEIIEEIWVNITSSILLIDFSYISFIFLSLLLGYRAPDCLRIFSNILTLVGSKGYIFGKIFLLGIEHSKFCDYRL